MPYYPINAGDLDRVVFLTTVTQSLDANRGPTISANTSSTAHWARIRKLTGREFESRGQVIGEATIEITLRYEAASGLKTKDQIRTSATAEVETATTIYEIESIVNPHQRGEYLIFMCRKLEAQS